MKTFGLSLLLVSVLLLESGCWQRVAIARGVKRVESGDGPIGQVVDGLTDDSNTDTSGHKTSATTSGSTYSGAY